MKNEDIKVLVQIKSNVTHSESFQTEDLLIKSG